MSTRIWRVPATPVANPHAGPPKQKLYVKANTKPRPPLRNVLLKHNQRRVAHAAAAAAVEADAGLPIDFPASDIMPTQLLHLMTTNTKILVAVCRGLRRARTASMQVRAPAIAARKQLLKDPFFKANRGVANSLVQLMMGNPSFVMDRAAPNFVGMLGRADTVAAIGVAATNAAAHAREAAAQAKAKQAERMDAFNAAEAEAAAAAKVRDGAAQDAASTVRMADSAGNTFRQATTIALQSRMMEEFVNTTLENEDQAGAGGGSGGAGPPTAADLTLKEAKEQAEAMLASAAKVKEQAEADALEMLMNARTSLEQTEKKKRLMQELMDQAKRDGEHQMTVAKRKLERVQRSNDALEGVAKKTTAEHLLRVRETKVVADRAKKLNDQTRATKQELAIAKKELEELNAMLDEVRHRFDRQMAELLTLDEQKAQSHAAKQKNDAECKRLEELRSSAHEELAKLKNKLSALKKASEGDRERVSGLVTAEERRLRKLQQKKENAQQHLVDLQKQTADAVDTAAAAAANIAEENQSLKEFMQTLQKDVEALKRQATEERARVAAAKEEAARVETATRQKRKAVEMHITALRELVAVDGAPAGARIDGAATGAPTRLRARLEEVEEVGGGASAAPSDDEEEEEKKDDAEEEEKDDTEEVEETDLAADMAAAAQRIRLVLPIRHGRAKQFTYLRAAQPKYIDNIANTTNTQARLLARIAHFHKMPELMLNDRAGSTSSKTKSSFFQCRRILNGQFVAPTSAEMASLHFALPKEGVVGVAVPPIRFVQLHTKEFNRLMFIRSVIIYHRLMEEDDMPVLWSSAIQKVSKAFRRASIYDERVIMGESPFDVSVAECKAARDPNHRKSLATTNVVELRRTERIFVDSFRASASFKPKTRSMRWFYNLKPKDLWTLCGRGNSFVVSRIMQCMAVRLIVHNGLDLCTACAAMEAKWLEAGIFPRANFYTVNSTMSKIKKSGSVPMFGGPVTTMHDVNTMWTLPITAQWK